MSSEEYIRPAGKVSITQQNSNSKNSQICIKINDGISGLLITEVLMTPHDFAKCLTGLAHSPAASIRLPSESDVKHFGKKRIACTWTCDKSKAIGSVGQRVLVRSHFREARALADNPNWLLHNDGCDSQQPGDRHAYTVIRFEEVE